MLLGAPTVERVFVVAAQVESERIAAPLAVGTRALFLLGRERRAQYRTSDLKNIRLRELTDGSPLFSLRFGGALELDAAGQAQVPEGVELPAALSQGEPGLSADELLTWVDAHLDEILPVLRGAHHTTGPFYWYCSVQADGSWACRTDEPERFSQEQTDDFWRKVREARLHELPGNIGSSPGPDSSSRFLHLRSREGVVRIRIWNERPSDTPKEVALRRRAMDIWEALPGDGKP